MPAPVSRTYNPAFTGDVRINGDYGDGDVLGANPPAYIDWTAFQSPAPSRTVIRRARWRSISRNPHYFNQDLSIRRDFPISGMKFGLGVDVFNVFNTVVFGGIQTNITNRTSGGWGRRPTHRASVSSSSGWSSEVVPAASALAASPH